MHDPVSTLPTKRVVQAPATLLAWSQRYKEWGEILPPRSAPTFANPTQQLDFRRFSSDTLLELYEMEKEILREATPEIPITTNFMGFFKPVDYWKRAQREDLVSDDSYPDPSDPEAHIRAAMSRDLMRSLGEPHGSCFVPMATGQANRLDALDGESYGCDLCADLIHLEGVEPLASYSHTCSSILSKWQF